MKVMKKVKILVASVLFCAMGYTGYTGYTAYEKMTISEVEKFMNTNIEALTFDETPGGSGGGAYSCSATTQCSAIFPNSTISCTGDNYCKRGLDIVKGAYVECDGHKTYC